MKHKGSLIKFFNKDAYGFLKSDTCENDVFVHITQFPIAEKFYIGDEFFFELDKNEKGIVAVRLESIKKEKEELGEKDDNV